MVKKIVYQILKIFWLLPIKQDCIFFTSFNGTVYGYDSKAMAEYIEQHYPGQYTLVWGTKDGKLKGYDGSIPIQLVKIKSLAGILSMIRAGTLIYNINPPSYIPFRKSQLLINTWHGFAYKKVGKYAAKYNKKQFNTTNCFLSHAKVYTDTVIRESFEYSGKVLEIGLPRNDLLFENNQSKIIEIKESLKVNQKNIALFAPTFRGDFCFEESELDFELLKYNLHMRFGGEWIILCRLHPMLVGKYTIKASKALDVSDYPDMCDLLLITNVLITDYSSSMWDFSLTGKPVFLFTSDIDQYIQERGLYFSPEQIPFPIAKTNDQLTAIIKAFNSEQYSNTIAKYLKNMGSYENGKACLHLMNYIISLKKEI